MLTLHPILCALSATPSVQGRLRLLPAFREAVAFVPGELLKHSTSTTDILIEEVLSHLEERFVFRNMSYRGDHGEASARRMIAKSARNRLVSLLRKQRARREVGDRLQGDSDGRFDRAFLRSQRVWKALKEALSTGRIEARVRRDIRLVLEVAWEDSDTRQQAVRHGFASAADVDDPAEWPRIRNRVDNRRRHGRKSLHRLLHELVAQSRVSREDAEIFAALSGCPIATERSAARASPSRTAPTRMTR